MIKAVIFDVDGVLVDSRRANFVYISETLKKLGYREIKEEEYRELFHHTGEDVIKTLLPDLTEKEYDEIRDYQLKVSPDYFKFAELNPGVKEILEFIRTKEILLGVVTNRTTSATKILEFFNIRDYFKVIIGSHDVTNAKPHPEPVLKAAEMLGVKPGETIYIGDSESDVQSANDAGAISVFYSEKENSNAKFNISDLTELRKIISL